MINSIGCIELSSIATGYIVADAMIKSANVEIVWNEIHCPGRLMLMILGDTSSVSAAIEVGLTKGGAQVVNSLVLSRIHTDVLEAIRKRKSTKNIKSLGVLEAQSVSSAIEAADIAVKSSNVEILSINVSIGIAGKGVVTITGDIASITSAVEIAVKNAANKGTILHTAVIANPSPSILTRKRP